MIFLPKTIDLFIIHDIFTQNYWFVLTEPRCSQNSTPNGAHLPSGQKVWVSNSYWKIHQTSLWKSSMIFTNIYCNGSSPKIFSQDIHIKSPFLFSLLALLSMRVSASLWKREALRSTTSSWQNIHTDIFSSTKYSYRNFFIETKCPFKFFHRDKIFLQNFFQTDKIFT